MSKAASAPPRLEKLDREVAAIWVLAEMAREDAPTAPTDRVWLIVARDGAASAGSVRRAGGPPIGVDEATRPRTPRGEYMHHLVTLDLAELPELRKVPKLADARAVAVFVADHLDNQACAVNTTETAVLALTQSDVDKGEWSGPEVDDPEATSFFLVPVDVPVTVFDKEATGTHDFNSLDADERRYESTDKVRAMLRAFVTKTANTPAARLAALRSELMNVDHVGGRAVFWSEHTFDEDFLFQFTEDLLEVNLGDAGTMYVFASTAFWAGH